MPPPDAPTPMRLDVLTLFPDAFASVLNSSILKRAAETVHYPSGKLPPRPPVVAYHLHDLRGFADSKHDKVDKPPYGGGPGMVIQCQPVWDAVRSIQQHDPDTPPLRIVVTPTGRPLSQRLVEDLAARPRLLILCGHYEGFDQRVLDALHEETDGAATLPDGDGLLEVSLGDYVLSGGELAAMVLIDAVTRLQPGALGDDASAAHESFSTDLAGGLEDPHYTRPAQWRGRDVPDVLRSGDHAKIDAWRREQSAQRTRDRRPDLARAAAAINTADAPSTGPPVTLRPGCDDDTPAVDALLRGAFDTDFEARLVRVLRAQDRDVAEWVATRPARRGDDVLGYALLTAVTLEGAADDRVWLGLGPLAVNTDARRAGLGAALVQQCLRDAAQRGAAGVFVLGDPAYYRRFGFTPASTHGIANPFGVDDAFMLVLTTDTPPPADTTARYAPAFTDLPGA